MHDIFKNTIFREVTAKNFRKFVRETWSYNARRAIRRKDAFQNGEQGFS